MSKKKRVLMESPKPSENSSAKLTAIRLAMDQIEKQYGKGSIMRLGEKADVRFKIDVVPTGSIALDLALGVGGFPRGRIIEIYGPEASGKTTLALHVIAEAQKRGGQCAFVDAEHALDPGRAEIIGVNLDDLLMSQPDTGEQALEITETLIRSGALDVIVVDSVAALVPRAELEGEMGDAVMGLQARLMSQALRKLTGAISKSRTILIFTNQLRQKIGVMFGNPETTPGGKALKFYTSVRIDIRRIAQIKKGDETVGGRHRVKIVKNKVAAPFRQTEFDMLYGDGISKEGEALALGEKYGFVEKSSGGSYQCGEHKLGRGYDAARTYLRENKPVLNQLLKDIRKALADGGTAKKSDEDKEE